MRQSLSRTPLRLALESLEDRSVPATLPTNFSEVAVATGLSGATAMELSPLGHLFVTEQAGTLEVWQNGTRQQANFFANAPLPLYNPNTDTGLLDNRGERGLLSVTFDPAFGTNRFVYVYYTYAVNPDGNTGTPTTIRNRVSRFTANAAGDLAVAGTEQLILDLDNLAATNHNGGAIRFGPDGRLFVAVGDNNVGSNAQTLANRHGKILRVNADGSIPTDNPFFDTATGANRAIWALGLRNPYTFAFQPGTGVLHVNDVGQSSWEEVNVGAAGANYGWPATEGDFNQSDFPAFTRPFYAYSHGSGTFQGRAISGGAFYNPAEPGANRFPAAYTGDYFFGDFVNNWINVIDTSTREVARFATNAPGMVDLRLAADGGLLYLARGAGSVFRVIYTPPGPQVIDDGQPGFTTTGTWDTYAGLGNAGDFTYASSGGASAVASYMFTVTPGLYRVAATWVERPNRADNAPYTVLDGATVAATARVNQRLAPDDFTDAGTPWETLAASVGVAGTSLVVRLGNDATPAYVIADAVRVERIGDLPSGPEVVVQDGSADIADNTGAVDFGSAAVGAPVSKTFTVRNLGTSTLTLTPPITVPAGFTVTAGFGSTSLAPNASTTFVVRLDAAAAGTYTGQLSFGTNDADENPFNFTVSGTVADPAAVQIVDDSTAGFTTTGPWDSYSGLGHLGNLRYTTSGTGGAVATWTFAVTPGQYQVATTWLERPNRPTNAPYRVLNGGTTVATMAINQRLAPNDFTDAGSSWERMPTVTITGTTLVVRLSNDAGPEYVIADAVRIERVGDVPEGPQVEVRDGPTPVARGATVALGTTLRGVPVTKEFAVANTGTQDLVLQTPIAVPAGYTLVESFGATTLAPGATTTFRVRLDAASAGTFAGEVSFGTNDADDNPFRFTVTGVVSNVVIVDDGSPGFAASAGWETYVGVGFGNDIRYLQSGTGSQAATWTFAVAPGTYRVAATWHANTNRATNAPFALLDGSTTVGSVRVNQRNAPADFTDAGVGWQYLGGVVTITGNTLVVRLTDDADPLQYLIADAIRLERVG